MQYAGMCKIHFNRRTLDSIGIRHFEEISGNDHYNGQNPNIVNKTGISQEITLHIDIFGSSKTDNMNAHKIHFNCVKMRN